MEFKLSYTCKQKGGKKQRQIQEEHSENLDNEDDLNLNDQANMGGIDQENLTAEQREEQIIKTLTTNNPQAPDNQC